MGDVFSGSIGLGLFGQGYLTLGSKPPGGNFLFHLFNETRQQSESLEPLIGSLAFVVGKL